MASVLNVVVEIMPSSASSVSRTVSTGVEQRLLVLLHVLVVGERQSLERREETREVADESTCLAPGEFGNIGVLLLGHHRRPGREPVVEGHESELRRCPQDPLLADTAQVHPEQRHGEERLGHKVSIGDTVKAVVEDRIEAEIGGGLFRVERQRRTSQRSRAEHRDIRALAGIDQPLGIASQSPAMGEQMVREGDGLRLLEVGVTGQVGVARLLGVGQSVRCSRSTRSSTSSIAERVQSRRSVAT